MCPTYYTRYARANPVILRRVPVVIIELVSTVAWRIFHEERGLSSSGHRHGQLIAQTHPPRVCGVCSSSVLLFLLLGAPLLGVVDTCWEKYHDHPLRSVSLLDCDTTPHTHTEEKNIHGLYKNTYYCSLLACLLACACGVVRAKKKS